MSVSYRNELVIVGDRVDIDNAMPSLIEGGWHVEDRDRLCVKLVNTEGCQSIPSLVAKNVSLHASMGSYGGSNLNWAYVEVSGLGYRASTSGNPHGLHTDLDHLLPKDTNSLSVAKAIEISRLKQDLELLRVTDLTPEAAAELAPHAHTLALPSLKSLTPATARELAKHRGPLLLDGLSELPVRVARELAAHHCTLSFGGLSSVTVEAIEALAAGIPHPAHPGFTTRHTGQLILDGLTHLTPELARAIAKHPHCICLGGLTALTPEVARELGVDRNGVIELRGIEHIGDEEAELLGRTTAGLMLSGLKTITPRAAAGLAKESGSLFLNGLQDIPLPVALALAEHRGYLGLWGVKSASSESLAALAEHRGPVTLGLDGGTSLGRHRN